MFAGGIKHILRRQRRRAQSGFTLVEMLAALIVLMLLTSMIVMGANSGMAMYRSSTFESQSEELSSTIDNALSDSFRYMTSSTNATTKVTTYTIVYQDNADNGTIVDSNPQLGITDGILYLKGTDAGGNQLDLKVLNASAYGNLKLTAAKLTCSPTVVSVTYTVASSTDSSKTKDYTLTYVPSKATKSAA